MPNVSRTGLCILPQILAVSFFILASPSSALATPGQLFGDAPIVPSPFPGSPSLLLSAPDSDETFARVGDNWITLSTGQSAGSAHGSVCAVGPKLALVCLASETKGSGDRAEKSLVVTDKDGFKQQIYTIHGKGKLLPLAIAFTQRGAMAIAFQESGLSDSGELGDYVIVGSEKHKLSGNSSPNRGGDSAYSGRIAPAVQFAELQGRLLAVYRSQGAIYVERVGDSSKKAPVAYSSRYDFSALATANGYLYVLYHAEEDMSLHAAISQDGLTFSDLALDARQSGRQISAATFGDTLVAVYTFYRDPLSKGLRAIALQSGNPTARPVTIAQNPELDAGLDPHLSISRQGSSWLSFVSNSSTGEREWWRTSPEGIVIERLGEYLSPRETYKDWFLQYGVGAGYNWWLIGDAGSTNSSPSMYYSIKTNKLMTASFDLRGGDLGLSLALGQEIGSNLQSPKSTRSVAASLSLGVTDQDDLRLSLGYARYSGTVAWSEKSGTRTERTIDTRPLSLRTEFVLGVGARFGLEYRNFQIPAGVHTFFKPEGETTPKYVSSFIRDVRFHNIHFLVGYSSLDHSRKEKASYNRPFVDFGLGIGVLVATFDSVPVQGENVSSYTGLSFKTDLQLGWLFFRRWRSLAGGGFYGRPFYAIDLAYMGEWPFSGTARKSSSYSDTEESTVSGEKRSAQPQLLSLNHALMMDLGMIW